MLRKGLVLAAAISLLGFAGSALAQGKPTTAGGVAGPGDRAQLVLDVRKESVVHLHGWARSSKNNMNSVMTAILAFGLENGGTRICDSAEGAEWQGDAGSLNASVSCMATLAPGRYVMTLSAPNKRSDGRNAEIHYILVEK